MPKYIVHVCRIAYQHLDIVVTATNKGEAMRIAERDAPGYVFPTENSSEYEAQTATRQDEQQGR